MSYYSYNSYPGSWATETDQFGNVFPAYPPYFRGHPFPTPSLAPYQPRLGCEIMNHSCCPNQGQAPQASAPYTDRYQKKLIKTLRGIDSNIVGLGDEIHDFRQALIDDLNDKDTASTVSGSVFIPPSQPSSSGSIRNFVHGSPFRSRGLSVASPGSLVSEPKDIHPLTCSLHVQRGDIKDFPVCQFCMKATDFARRYPICGACFRGNTTVSPENLEPIAGAVRRQSRATFRMLETDLIETRNRLQDLRVAAEGTQAENVQNQVRLLADRLEESINQDLARIRVVHSAQEQRAGTSASGPILLQLPPGMSSVSHNNAIDPEPSCQSPVRVDSFDFPGPPSGLLHIPGHARPVSLLTGSPRPGSYMSTRSTGYQAPSVSSLPTSDDEEVGTERGGVRSSHGYDASDEKCLSA